MEQILQRVDFALPCNESCSLECGMSDHKPIITHPFGIPVRKQKPWRFKQVWF